jgi:ectoine hydroxylase-related dioxygenase (phytanoyl-CoA dioxygenase family)
VRLTDGQKQQYHRDGFLLIPQALPSVAIEQVAAEFLGLVEKWGGRRFDSVQSTDLARFLLDNRELERKLYDEIRHFPWLVEFGRSAEIAQPVSELLGERAGLMGKIPFRIDLPGVTRELAVWHQDYRYVQGNTDIITAWMPLQDTPYLRGCLMVMPGSQSLGILDHDMEVLGKRHFPSSVFGREVRYVEMQKGDLLLFHSLLLHSSSLNMSSTVRLSIQARYSALSAPTDPAMGQLILV